MWSWCFCTHVCRRHCNCFRYCPRITKTHRYCLLSSTSKHTIPNQLVVSVLTKYLNRLKTVTLKENIWRSFFSTCIWLLNMLSYNSISTFIWQTKLFRYIKKYDTTVQLSSLIYAMSFNCVVICILIRLKKVVLRTSKMKHVVIATKYVHTL